MILGRALALVLMVAFAGCSNQNIDDTTEFEVVPDATPALGPQSYEFETATYTIEAFVAGEVTFSEELNVTLNWINGDVLVEASLTGIPQHRGLLPPWRANDVSIRIDAATGATLEIQQDGDTLFPWGSRIFVPQPEEFIFRDRVSPGARDVVPLGPQWAWNLGLGEHAWGQTTIEQRESNGKWTQIVHSSCVWSCPQQGAKLGADGPSHNMTLKMNGTGPGFLPMQAMWTNEVTPNETLVAMRTQHAVAGNAISREFAAANPVSAPQPHSCGFIPCEEDLPWNRSLQAGQQALLDSPQWEEWAATRTEIVPLFASLSVGWGRTTVAGAVSLWRDEMHWAFTFWQEGEQNKTMFKLTATGNETLEIWSPITVSGVSTTPTEPENNFETRYGTGGTLDSAIANMLPPGTSLYDVKEIEIHYRPPHPWGPDVTQWLRLDMAEQGFIVWGLQDYGRPVLFQESRGSMLQ